MSKVFLAMPKLSWGSGSTRTIMYRSKGLVERGYDVSILTFNDFNTAKKKKELTEMRRLDKKVKTFNIYDDYRSRNTKKNMTGKQKRYYKKISKVREKGMEVITNESNRSARYFKNGTLVKSKQWKKNGTLSYMNLYDENENKTIRETFHKNGYVKKKTLFDPSNEERMHIQYFTQDEFCFLDSWDTKYKDEYKHFLYDRYTERIYSFKKDNDFYTHWLNQVCSEQNQKPYIICDKRETSTSIMNMESDKAFRIYVIHRNHFKYPFTLGSPIKTKEKTVLDRIKEHDRVVTLTEKQKRDIIAEFNDYENISVIPHSIPQTSNENIKKDDKTISMVGRLHPTKQVTQTVEAFKQVVQEIPGAKLELYGSGELEEELSKQIKKLGLEKNVFLMGYAKNTDKVYQKSLATLLTSKYEAFSLVLLESMMNGTPVISYDVNYGPSDIITNGEDGYLISQDLQVLADKIVELLRDPKKTHKMGKKAKENASQKFGEQVVMDKWRDLFDSFKNEQT